MSDSDYTLALPDRRDMLADSKQLLLSLAETPTAQKGYLYCCERDASGRWHVAGEGIPTALGKAGLAWGKGLFPDSGKTGAQRREGVAHTPMGLFDLGTAFGTADFDLHWPYRHSAPTDRCVDDPESKHYNQIVDAASVRPDWQSAEEMRRPDGLYEWGLFVKHNCPARGGFGSCIMLHVWRQGGKPTQGCTAMPKEKMLGVLQWLRPAARPRLLQLTRPLYASLPTHWELPSVD